jgi:hypothetical protein
MHVCIHIYPPASIMPHDAINKLLCDVVDKSKELVCQTAPKFTTVWHVWLDTRQLSTLSPDQLIACMHWLKYLTQYSWHASLDDIASKLGPWNTLKALTNAAAHRDPAALKAAACLLESVRTVWNQDLQYERTRPPAFTIRDAYYAGVMRALAQRFTEWAGRESLLHAVQMVKRFEQDMPTINIKEWLQVGSDAEG